MIIRASSPDKAAYHSVPYPDHEVLFEHFSVLRDPDRGHSIVCRCWFVEMMLATAQIGRTEQTEKIGRIGQAGHSRGGRLVAVVYSVNAVPSQRCFSY